MLLIIQYVNIPCEEPSLEVRTHPAFLETLIWKYDSGPVKLPGLSRNGPQVLKVSSPFLKHTKLIFYLIDLM